MIFVGMLAALGTLLFAGFGVTTLLMRGAARIKALEATALAWLFGSGLISLTLWIGGMLFSGPALQTVTAGVAIALGAAGIALGRSQNLRWSIPAPKNALQWILGAIVFLEIVIVTYLSFSRGLDWDGFLNWEAKARYAFLNDGVVPAAYYTSETRAFTHPGYPLLIPLTELWFYLCMGEAHQMWIKIIFPLYYAAGAILLAIAANRLTNRGWPGPLAASLLFFVPCLTGSPGGATSGYVDVPLGALYVATTGYLLVYLVDNRLPTFRIFASCLALLPWAKKEGAILWAVAAVCGTVIIWRQRRWSSLLWLLPGAVLIFSWKIFLVAAKAVEARDFVPVTLTTLGQNLDRALPICRLILAEIVDATHWSIFWPMALCAFVFLLFRARDRRLLILSVVVIAPLVAYAATFLFSAWTDYSDHLRTSFPRLLLHVMPVAWLAVALAMSKPAHAIRFRTTDQETGSAA